MCVREIDNMIECCREWREQSFCCEGFLHLFKEEDDNKNNDNKQENSDQKL